VEHYLKKHDEGYFYICAIEPSSVALLLFKAIGINGFKKIICSGNHHRCLHEVE